MGVPRLFKEVGDSKLYILRLTILYCGSTDHEPTEKIYAIGVSRATQRNLYILP